MDNHVSEEEKKAAHKKFQKQFVGLIVFIIAVIVILMLTGRGSLA